MGVSAMMRRVWGGTLGAMFIGLAACSGHKAAPRDFNELIPRLMAPVNHYANTTAAASNLFNVTSPDERRDAIAYLEKQKYGHEPPYMKAYEVLTTDPVAMVRAQAMRALASSRSFEALPYLIDGTTGKTGLKDPDAEVRCDAAQGFLKVFSDSAVAPLAAHLAGDSDDQVRIAAARALRNSHTPAAYRALIAALDDKNAGVVYWAHESLLGSTNSKLGFDGKVWLAWYVKYYGPPATAPAPQG